LYGGTIFFVVFPAHFHRRSRYIGINPSSQNSRIAAIGGVHMSLVHYVRPFLELGICKEYRMARKTTENATTIRGKKAEVTVPAAAVQSALEVHKEVRKDGKPSNVVPINLEEEIRRRAYELYLERRATAAGQDGNGDENQDWLIAEREIRSRHGNQERHTA